MSSLPGLSLSSGPAVSGGPTTSGPGYTGDFTITRNGGDGWQVTLARVLPVALVLGAVLWITRR